MNLEDSTSKHRIGRPGRPERRLETSSDVDDLYIVDDESAVLVHLQSRSIMPRDVPEDFG